MLWKQFGPPLDAISPSTPARTQRRSQPNLPSGANLPSFVEKYVLFWTFFISLEICVLMALVTLFRFHAINFLLQNVTFIPYIGAKSLVFEANLKLFQGPGILKTRLLQNRATARMPTMPWQLFLITFAMETHFFHKMFAQPASSSRGWYSSVLTFPAQRKYFGRQYERLLANASSDSW